MDRESFGLTGKLMVEMAVEAFQLLCIFLDHIVCWALFLFVFSLRPLFLFVYKCTWAFGLLVSMCWLFNKISLSPK